MSVAVVGAGSWGTAVARHLAVRGNEVRLWSHNAAAAAYINENHVNPRYLTSCALPESVRAFTDEGECLDGVESVVLVVPSSTLRGTAARCAPSIGGGTPVAVLSKGIECGTGKLMTEVVADEIGSPGRIACLCGPNHAEEVSRDLPAATVVASADKETAVYFQGLFLSDRFRAYVSDDVVGVEICAAAKNVVAIACGIVRGLELGDNAAALVMTRGLAEMSRLVAACGGNPLTCMGLAGMGDLVATCTSPHSRNSTFGAAFAAGESLESYERRTHMVVEGARACRSIRELAGRREVEVPITEAVYDLLYGRAVMADVLARLYSRVPTAEFYGIS